MARVKMTRLTAQRHAGRKAGIFQGRTIGEGQGRPNLGRLSRLTVLRHGGRRAGTFFGRGNSAGAFVAAQANSNTDGLQGAARAAAAFVAAATASTTSTLSTGAASRPGVMRFSRLTSSRHAGRRAGYFARLSTGVTNFVAAAGTSTTGTLFGASEGLGRPITRFTRAKAVGWAVKYRGSFSRVPGAGFQAAQGSSQTGTLIGAAVSRASFAAAASASVSGTLYGSRTVAVDFASAAGLSIGNSMQGTNALATVVAGGFLPANGNSQGETLTIVGVTQTGFVPADGTTETYALPFSAVAKMDFISASGDSDTTGFQGTDANNPIAWGAFGVASAGSIGVAMQGGFATPEVVAPPPAQTGAVGGVIVRRETRTVVEQPIVTKEVTAVPWTDPDFAIKVANLEWQLLQMQAAFADMQAQVAMMNRPQVPMMPPPQFFAPIPKAKKPAAPKMVMQAQALPAPSSEESDIAFVASVLSQL
jgi:hypothetical protein